MNKIKRTSAWNINLSIKALKLAGLKVIAAFVFVRFNEIVVGALRGVVAS